MMSLKMSAALCFVRGNLASTCVLEHLGCSTFLVCLSARGELLGGSKAIDPHWLALTVILQLTEKQTGFPVLCT